MIGKHLWTVAGKWTARETRTCAKCKARVTYLKQPRCGVRVFKTVMLDYSLTVGAMQRCEP